MLREHSIAPAPAGYQNDQSDCVQMLDEGISMQEYLQRVANVRAALEPANLVGLIAFGDCWRSANVSYFTQFRPLHGASDIANAVVFIGVDGEPILFVSEQCHDFASSVTGFAVYPLSQLGQRLRRFLKEHRSGKFGLAGGAYIPASLLRRISGGLGSAPLQPTTLLAEIKAIKSDAEIRLLRKAAALTDTAWATIRDTLADGQPHTERELAWLADRAMLAGGADSTAYDSRVQAGPRSAFDLARPTDRVLQSGDLVMTNMGARYRGYVADGGRGFTYGDASKEKKAIVAATARAMEAGLAAARPGIAALELNAVIQNSLVEAGYEQYSNEARVHGTGHGTGMDPEEEEPWIGPGSETMLQENMVFTLKSTITVPNVGGLRTERIVRLIADGAEPLDQFPMELHW